MPNNQTNPKNSRLKILAIAYEFSKCHGYGVSESEAKEMWEETCFDENEVSVEGIGEFEGNSTNEISNMLAKEALTQE